MLFSVPVPVIELYPELEAVLEVVDPVLVKGVGFRIGGLGLMVVLVSGVRRRLSQLSH